MKNRTCIIKRKTKETDICLKLNIDGKGKAKIDTGLGILDHMLELFAFHGFFDLELKARGDLKTGLHHLNEDIGIVLGDAFKKALKEKRGIRRFGFFGVPMEENFAQVALDINGRGYLKLTVEDLSDFSSDAPEYSLKDLEHFLDSFCRHLGANFYIIIRASLTKDLHSIIEPVFKALGLALDYATQLDSRRKEIPSTKGIID